MTEMNDVFTLNKENWNYFESTGKILCKYCNGSGINPAYEEIDKTLKAIFNSDGPCCLYCYGLAEIDWIDKANGNYKQKMNSLKSKMKEWFLINIHPFLQYVQYGEVYFDENVIEWVNYDPADGSWNFSEIILDSIEGHRAKRKWIEKFKTDGYCDIKNIEKYNDIFPFGYPGGNYYFAAEIKAYLIGSRTMTIDELHEIKTTLKIMGFSIENLNWIKTVDMFEQDVPPEFEFNWNNLLDKFYLPRNNKYTPVPYGVLTF